MGRKKVFDNEETRKSFLLAIKMGFSIEKASDYALISDRIVYYYLAQGEEDEKNEVDSYYFRFLQEYKKARADFVMRHVARITEASDNGSWQASAWLLERRFPQDFALAKNEEKNNDVINVVNDVPMIENK